MAWINIIMVSITIVLGMLASYLLFKLGQKSALRVPIFLFCSAILSFTFGFMSIDVALVIVLLLDSSQHATLTNFFYRLGFILEMFGSYLMYLTLTLPRIKENSPRSLFYQLLAVSAFGVTAALNASTITIQLRYSEIVVKYDTMGLILLLVAVGLIVNALVLRIKDVEQVMTSKNIKRNYLLPVWGVVLFIFIIMGLIMWNESTTAGIIPNFTWTLAVGITFLYVTLAISKNEGFLFAIPVRVETLYLLDTNSSIVLYSKSFSEPEPTSQSQTLLGSILGGLKISLETLMTSKEGLRTIVFENKVIVMHSGTCVTTFLVVSEVNPLILEITAKLTSLFETTYQEQIAGSRMQRIIKPHQFRQFDQLVERINKQLLL